MRRLLNGKSISKSNFYAVHIHVYHEWVKPTGKPVKRDAINYAKVAEDEVFRALGCDDSHNFRTVIDKRRGSPPRVKVIIRPLGPIGQHPPLPSEGC